MFPTIGGLRLIRSCMNYTEAFCIACIGDQALEDSSPEAKIFVEVRRQARAPHMLIGETGHCFQCKKSGLVMSYVIDATMPADKTLAFPMMK